MARVAASGFAHLLALQAATGRRLIAVKDKLMAWAAGQGELQGKSFGEVCSSAQANAHVLAAVTATGERRML
jgi:hypothetical protein